LYLSYQNGEKMFSLRSREPSEICFFMNRASGYEGWLTSNQVISVMGEMLKHDTIEVFEQPDRIREGEKWYGFRMRATTEEAPEQDIHFNGRLRTIAKQVFQQEDYCYYFNHLETRNVVQKYLTS
jgi:hypothetical protein